MRTLPKMTDERADYERGQLDDDLFPDPYANVPVGGIWELIHGKEEEDK